MRSTLAARFWAKVDRRGPDECWPWTGSVDEHGRGRINSGGKEGKPRRASRVSYELANGPIPGGLHVLHGCDNPGCVNPAHLSLGTHLENMRDMYARGRDWASRQTHASCGHQFDGRDHRGARICVQCDRAKARAEARRATGRRVQYQRAWRAARRELAKMAKTGAFAASIPPPSP